MRLAVESRYVGNAAVCRCRGRIVCGAEARLVEERVRGNLCEVRDIVLHSARWNGSTAPAWECWYVYWQPHAPQAAI